MVVVTVDKRVPRLPSLRVDDRLEAQWSQVAKLRTQLRLPVGGGCSRPAPTSCPGPWSPDSAAKSGCQAAPALPETSCKPRPCSRPSPSPSRDARKWSSQVRCGCGGEAASPSCCTSAICRRVRRRPEKVVDFRSATRGSIGRCPQRFKDSMENRRELVNPSAQQRYIRATIGHSNQQLTGNAAKLLQTTTPIRMPLGVRRAVPVSVSTIRSGHRAGCAAEARGQASGVSPGLGMR